MLRDSNAVAICDEVYEHLVFDGRPHIPLASLPGMRERCLRVGSAGKMFSLTGWKVGWVTGAGRPDARRRQCASVHHLHDVARAAARHRARARTRDGFHAGAHARHFRPTATFCAQEYRSSAFNLLACEGSYFLTADISGLTNESDCVFCERLVREAGVALIPLSPFFTSGKPDNFVRFAFCKKRAVIDEAVNAA